jgi:expansin (peptidoglycan-binding protein)
MITLQYYNGKEWINVSNWHREDFAWASLGGDCYGYRTVNQDGTVLTDKSQFPDTQTNQDGK